MRLAPVYDLTFSAGPGGEHYLAVAGEGRTPARDHVDQVGRMHGIATTLITEIIDGVATAIADCPIHAAEAGIQTSLTDIGRRLESIRADFR